MGSPEKCIASTRPSVYRAGHGVGELREATPSTDGEQNKEMAAAAAVSFWWGDCTKTWRAR